MKKLILFILVILIIGGAYLFYKNDEVNEVENPIGETNVQIANPASVYCVEDMGGELEIVTDENGGQFGLCHLPDGTSIEEWELFRSNNNL